MSKIIAIDAGHGMGTAGKRCMKAIDPNETREWWLNDRIADRLQELLAAYDCKVIRVDDTTGAKDIALSARVKTANNVKADVYVSIHHNAGINGGSGGGTVVFYCSSQKERPSQAARLYYAILSETGLRGNRSQTVIKKSYYVIKNTTMPAFLIENGFMDSLKDTPIILTSAHGEKTAQGILKWLVKEFNLAQINSNIRDTDTDSDIYYPAYTGKKTTLSVALTSLGITNTYAYRKKIAKANSISGYCGTAAQNTQMYNMLVGGVLRRT